MADGGANLTNENSTRHNPSLCEKRFGIETMGKTKGWITKRLNTRNVSASDLYRCVTKKRLPSAAENNDRFNGL